ncbi:MAG: hypothetical protein OXI73_03585 [Rhodospirillales bacterium]|nr:hypothetical protein [Rhodospirillales bacterium]
MEKIAVDRIELFPTRKAAEIMALWIGEARVCPLVDSDREQLGFIVEHQSGEARLSVAAQWI